ncbi:flavin reductase family protein [Aureimonas fodinaquatilis]|nr:flavin reductase family protein [Aureimonas fodinaquatilis]
MDARELRNLFGHFATGVAVVTAKLPDGNKVGVTISSFNSISLEPELVMFSLTNTLLSLPAFESAVSYGINFLAADQQEVSRRFAVKGEDKWADTAMRHGESGAPLLDGALAHIECSLHQRVEAGDHVIFICRVISFATPGATKEPLVFFKGRYCGIETPAPLCQSA